VIAAATARPRSLWPQVRGFLRLSLRQHRPQHGTRAKKGGADTVVQLVLPLLDLKTGAALSAPAGEAENAQRHNTAGILPGPPPAMRQQEDTMTNEEIAQRIKAGEADLMGRLWENTERLLTWMIDRELISSEKAARAEAAGVTREDLYQEAYFALVAAVEAYDPESGLKLSSFLKYPVRNVVNKAIGLRTERTRRDPAAGAVSMDAPLNEDGDISLLEMIRDPDSSAPFEAVEERDYREHLRQDPEESLAALPCREGQVIRARYYAGKTLEEIGVCEGCSATRIEQIERQALDRLRLMDRLAGYREEILGCYEYKGGYRWWYEKRTSCVEAAVIRLDDMDRKAQLVDRWSALRSIKAQEEGET